MEPKRLSSQEWAEAMAERLRPSGQVAEDAQLIHTTMDHANLWRREHSSKTAGPEVYAALSRLAAKAQAHDAAVADNAALRRNALAIINHFTAPERGTGNWTPDLSRMAAEISAWPHPGAALEAEIVTLRGRAQKAEAERDKAKALAEKYHDQRDAALSDNAALKTAFDALDYAYTPGGDNAQRARACRAFSEQMLRPHPGATWPETHKSLVEAVSTLLALPFAIEEATIPSAGIDAAPDQVVGTLHVSLAKIRKLKEILAQIGGT
jgi:hypothetical protein